MPIEPTYTSEALRGVVRTTIAHEEWKEKSGASILKSLQERGLGIREKDFYSIRRDILGLTRFEEQVKRLRPDSRIPVAWFDPAKDWKLKGNFLYQARVYGRDPQTGEEIERFFACSSDQELFKEAAESLIANSLIGEEEHYRVVVERVEVFHAYHRAGYKFAP